MSLLVFDTYTNSINDCNTSLGEEDAMNRISTDGSFVPVFFPVGILAVASSVRTSIDDTT
ncbi:hypothetical protein [Anabaena sp. CCY 9910]|uniref:hypothetical protein n=1 Tax=Anabaena sp. CCY 9910 TaxID=3103870 RepID=UPI0039E05A47